MFTDMAKSDLRNRLEQSWSAETANVSDRWSPSKPSEGQCAITALLVHELTGAEILRGEIGGGSHYWNRLTLPSGDVLEIDLTRDQFDEWIDFDAPEAIRNIETRTQEDLMLNRSTRMRFETLKYRYEQTTVLVPVDEEIAGLVAPALTQTDVFTDEMVRAAGGPAFLTLSELQRDAWQVAEDHGWHEGEADGAMFVEKLCLIHSEVSEALEEYRDGHAWTETYHRYEDGKPEGIPIELADVLIRVFDVAEIFGIDLAEAVAEKQAFNRTRPFRHGGKKA